MQKENLFSFQVFPQMKLFLLQPKVHKFLDQEQILLKWNESVAYHMNIYPCAAGKNITT